MYGIDMSGPEEAFVAWLYINDLGDTFIVSEMYLLGQVKIEKCMGRTGSMTALAFPGEDLLDAVRRASDEKPFVNAEC